MTQIFEIEARQSQSNASEPTNNQPNNFSTYVRKKTITKAVKQEQNAQEFIDLIYDNLHNIKMTALNYCAKLWMLVHNKVTIDTSQI